MADKDPEKNDGGQKPPEPSPTGGDDKPKGIFTQADLDRLAESQRKRGIEKGQADLLESLGVDSVDAIKAALEDAAKLRESQMSEKEKLEAKLAEAKATAEAAAAEAEAAKSAATEKLMQAAVIREASKQDYHLYNEAISDVWLHIKRDSIKLNDDGTFDGVDRAVKAVIEKRPFMVNGNGSKPPGTPRQRKQVKPDDSNRPKSRTVRF